MICSLVPGADAMPPGAQQQQGVLPGAPLRRAHPLQAGRQVKKANNQGRCESSAVQWAYPVCHVTLNPTHVHATPHLLANQPPSHTPAQHNKERACVRGGVSALLSLKCSASGSGSAASLLSTRRHWRSTSSSSWALTSAPKKSSLASVCLAPLPPPPPPPPVAESAAKAAPGGGVAPRLPPPPDVAGPSAAPPPAEGCSLCRRTASRAARCKGRW
jgi:hypothetical protein